MIDETQEQQLKQNEGKYKTVATKISPAMAEVLSAIAKAKGMEVYELIQLCCWFIVKMSSPEHNLSEELEKLMILFHNEPGWADAFNLCNPSAVADIEEEILILQQEGKHGLGAVKITKPWMGVWKQTECVEDIVERVIEVCLPGIYKRLRYLTTDLGCESIVDTLVTLADAQMIERLNEMNRQEYEEAANYTEGGRQLEYGQRTRQKKHLSPDSPGFQTRIDFDEYDAGTIDATDNGGLCQRHATETDEPEQPTYRPFDVED